MDAEEISWLRSNGHRIRIGVTAEGAAFFEFDDFEFRDAMDDYLVEVLEERLGAVWFRDLANRPSLATYQIVFRDAQVRTSRLQDVLNGLSP